ncbi:MAG: diacylglycerol kinase family protein [Bacilli bacterium]|nr:diacylglycerol kinase family protein [Bacilli bacterium]
MGLLARLFKKTPKRNKEEGTALERYIKSFLHAIDGFLYCLRYEHNMIIILTATIVVTIAGFYFQISGFEWLFIVGICGAISACEMINSSIEATIDLCTEDIHPLAKIAKDTASAATLILVVTSVIGAFIIFLPKILSSIGV